MAPQLVRTTIAVGHRLGGWGRALQLGRGAGILCPPGGRTEKRAGEVLWPTIFRQDGVDSVRED